MPSQEGQRGVLRAAAVVYLSIESLALIAFWVVLLARPELTSVFAVENVAPSAFRALAAPDAAVYLLTGLASIVGILRRETWAVPALWMHAGAATYASVLSLAWAAFSPGGWLGATLMLPALVAPILAACVGGPGRRLSP